MDLKFDNEDEAAAVRDAIDTAVAEARENYPPPQRARIPSEGRRRASEEDCRNALRWYRVLRRAQKAVYAAEIKGRIH